MSERMPDLSKRAVDKAVLSGALQHPAVVYPAAGAVIGGLGAAVLTASPLLIAGAAVGGGIALVSLGVNYLFRRDFFAARYLESAHRNLVAYREALLQDLEKDLVAVKAKEAIAQLDRFGEKLRTFEDVLDDKLDRKEITFARFMGIAEQVYLSGLDNLRQVAAVRKSAGVVDEGYIRGRIKALKSAGGEISKAKKDELAGLEKQLELAAKHGTSVEELLAQNEQALAQMDAALAAITDMKTGAAHSSVGMETAMSDLQHIANRAHAYSTSQA
jgi:methyl-accepting chemotaxis protein